MVLLHYAYLDGHCTIVQKDCLCVYLLSKNLILSYHERGVRLVAHSLQMHLLIQHALGKNMNLLPLLCQDCDYKQCHNQLIDVIEDL